MRIAFSGNSVSTFVSFFSELRILTVHAIQFDDMKQASKIMRKVFVEFFRPT